MKSQKRVARSDTVARIDLESGRVSRRRRRSISAHGPFPRRSPRVVGPPIEESSPIATRVAIAFSPEDYIHSDTSLVCELAPMADVELGEEPFPVFPWILAGIHDHSD